MRLTKRRKGRSKLQARTHTLRHRHAASPGQTRFDFSAPTVSHAFIIRDPDSPLLNNQETLPLHFRSCSFVSVFIFPLCLSCFRVRLSFDFIGLVAFRAGHDNNHRSLCIYKSSEQTSRPTCRSNQSVDSGLVDSKIKAVAIRARRTVRPLGPVCAERPRLPPSLISYAKVPTCEASITQ